MASLPAKIDGEKRFHQTFFRFPGVWCVSDFYISIQENFQTMKCITETENYD